MALMEVAVTLTDWRVTPTSGTSGVPKVREDRGAVWKFRGVPEDAATAFYGSLFPTEQTFSATDYRLGFPTFGFAPGTTFDLSLAWWTGGTSHASTIRGCMRAMNLGSDMPVGWSSLAPPRNLLSQRAAQLPDPRASVPEARCRPGPARQPVPIRPPASWHSGAVASRFARCSGRIDR